MEINNYYITIMPCYPIHYTHQKTAFRMITGIDVMVVAILIVSVKLGAIASIQVHAGLYIFGAAVLLIMFITQQVVSLSKTALVS